MNFKRIGRMLICLVLVCALLVNISPIKAEAVAIESALGIGIAACLILAAGGMIYTGLTQNEIIGVGNAFSTYMYQWGTSAEKLDEVEEFVGGLTLYNGSGDGDDDDDYDRRFTIPDLFKRAVAGFTAAAILAGSLNVELDEIAANGYAYYNGYLFAMIPDHTFPSIYPYKTIVFHPSSDKYRLYLSSAPLHFKSNGQLYRTSSINVCLSEYDSVNETWGSYSSGHTSEGIVAYTTFELLWANYDVYDYEDLSSLVLSASEPSSVGTQTTTVEPSIYVGDIPTQVQDGTITEENLELPSIFDYSTLVAANPDLSVGVMDYLQQVADGTVTYEDYMATIQPAVEPEPEPEPSEETSPSEETFPAIVPDAGEDTVGNTNANTFLQEMTDIVTTPFKWIWSNLETKLDTLKPLEFDFDKLTSIVTEPAKWIWGNIESYFTPLFDSTWSYIQAIPAKIAETGADLGTKLQTIPDAIADAATQVKTAVEEAVEKAFVPEKDYLTDKVNALCTEFAFADSIVRTAEALKIGLAGVTTEPPVIYIHLEDTRGSYNIGGTVPFLDLRWYAEYKPTVDALISAFLWICFVWRMLVKLPGIISGMPGDFVMASAHQMGVAEHLPTRSKEYEIQRISNREMIRKGPDK